MNLPGHISAYDPSAMGWAGAQAGFQNAHFNGLGPLAALAGAGLGAGAGALFNPEGKRLKGALIGAGLGGLGGAALGYGYPALQEGVSSYKQVSNLRNELTDELANYGQTADNPQGAAANPEYLRKLYRWAMNRNEFLDMDKDTRKAVGSDAPRKEWMGMKTKVPPGAYPAFQSARRFLAGQQLEDGSQVPRSEAVNAIRYGNTTVLGDAWDRGGVNALRRHVSEFQNPEGLPDKPSLDMVQALLAAYNNR